MQDFVSVFANGGIDALGDGFEMSAVVFIVLMHLSLMICDFILSVSAPKIVEFPLLLLLFIEVALVVVHVGMIIGAALLNHVSKLRVLFRSSSLFLEFNLILSQLTKAVLQQLSLYNETSSDFTETDVDSLTSTCFYLRLSFS